MRKLLIALLLLPLLAACDRVPPGHVGILVNLLGGEKGVDTEELPVGRYWVGINEELYLFPTFQQNAEWTQDSREGSEVDEALYFQSKDGLEFSADVAVSYSFNPDMITEIFQTYRRGTDEITDVVVRNVVRDSLTKRSSSLSSEEIYGEGKVKLIDSVLADTRSSLESRGINIHTLSWMGKIRVPDLVETAINDKVSSNQKAQQRNNEIQTSIAEARKAEEAAKGEAAAIMAVAEARAKANRVLAESITPELVEYLKTEKWDGKLPTYTGGPTPMIQVPDLAQQ